MSQGSKTALGLLALLAAGSSVLGRGAAQEGGKAPNEAAISLCKVLASPQQYAGKTVTVRATYRVAFEASELYCLSCSEGDRVWVEFDSADGGDKAAKALRRLIPHDNGTVNGVFTGVFRPDDRYGHLGAYQHQLSVGSVSHLKLVDHLGSVPARLSSESRKKVCQ
jgi:hypothetical protein